MKQIQKRFNIHLRRVRIIAAARLLAASVAAPLGAQAVRFPHLAFGH
jgi:hypothetical protein